MAGPVVGPACPLCGGVGRSCDQGATLLAQRQNGRRACVYRGLWLGSLIAPAGTFTRDFPKPLRERRSGRFQLAVSVHGQSGGDAEININDPGQTGF